MQALQRESIISKAADLLRQQITKGALRNRIPGVRALSAELAVSRDTARAALVQLEEEGWLCSTGHGRSRQVADTLPDSSSGRRVLSFAMVTFEPVAKLSATVQEVYFRACQLIKAEGWALQFLTVEGPLDRSEMQRKTASLHADAWVICQPPSDYVQWFIEQRVPAFAFGGLIKDLPIAGNAIFMATGVEQAVNHFRALGHRRIVLLAPSFLRKPVPSNAIARFIEVMASTGIDVNDYNLPDWKETPEGLAVLLSKLHAVTPPTAYLIADSRFALGVLSFFNARGVRVPRDCSVAVMRSDSFSDWWLPGIAHFEWNACDYAEQLRRWLKSVAKGKPNFEQRLEPTTFIPGASVGAPPRL